MLEAITRVLLVANVVWFTAGVWQFVKNARRSSYGLVPAGEVSAVGRRGVVGAFQFLGGLNFAFAALCAMALASFNKFAESLMVVPLVTIAIAHGSQFMVNLPAAIDEARHRPAPWHVLRGLMLIIFITDFVLAATNFTVALFWLRTG